MVEEIMDWKSLQLSARRILPPFPILGFGGMHRFLSNFWPATVDLNGTTYATVEHAYQTAKTFDEGWRLKIRHAKRPGKAKRIGGKAPLRPDWDEVKVMVMMDLLRQKFARDDMRTALLRTGTRRIEETNTWNDTFWGVCDGVGENHMGRLLMQVRDELRVDAP